MHIRTWLVCVAWCGIVQTPLLGQSSPLNLKHLDGRRLVFVVNGAGESTSVSDELTALACETDPPLQVQMVDWCRGAHPLHDYQDFMPRWKATRQLAGWTTLIRRDCPRAEIYFVAHSAGAPIVLAAAEALPAGSINRIILIAPAAGSTHDLRPALRASRGGMDHFWSAEDGFLERVTERWGLPDGRKGAAAATVGFRQPTWTDTEGFAAYRNLRQHRWHAGLSGTGGHSTWTSRSMLREHVVPLLVQANVATK